MIFSYPGGREEGEFHGWVDGCFSFFVPPCEDLHTQLFMSCVERSCGSTRSMPQVALACTPDQRDFMCIRVSVGCRKSLLQSPETEENGPEKELLDRLRAEEVGKSHFTYIVLTLRDQHLEVSHSVDLSDYIVFLFSLKTQIT